MPAAEFGRRCGDDPVARCPPPRSAMPPSAASVAAQAPSSPRIATNNSAKPETPAPPSGAAPHRRLAQVEQLDRRCCRRSPRARERAAIKVNGDLRRGRSSRGGFGVDPLPHHAAGPTRRRSDHREIEIRRGRIRHCPRARVRPTNRVNRGGLRRALGGRPFEYLVGLSITHKSAASCAARILQFLNRMNRL